MEEAFQAAYEAALRALEQGDAVGAFEAYGWSLAYPGVPDARFGQAFALFARIARMVAGEEWAELVDAVCEAPDDVRALFDLGYQLVEQSQPGIAASVLARANRLQPGQPAVVTELVCSLESLGLHGEACQVLETSGLLGSSPLCQYLLAYNTLMTARVDGARSLLRQLRAQSLTADVHSMVEQLEQMVARADALRGVTPLDSADLRGWHLVVSGGLLLRCAPDTLPGTGGRYLETRDSEARCLEGIFRVEALLRRVGQLPPRVFQLPQVESAALALAAARVLRVPVEPWYEEGDEAPGLIVVYDLGALTHDWLASLANHRPGQLLWAHASCWTQEPAFGPDLVTYLYQHNASPWEPLEEGLESWAGPPQAWDPSRLATGILQASVPREAFDDLPRLLALAEAAFAMNGPHAPGCCLRGGRRRRQRSDSPVPGRRE